MSKKKTGLGDGGSASPMVYFFSSLYWVKAGKSQWDLSVWMLVLGWPRQMGEEVIVVLVVFDESHGNGLVLAGDHVSHLKVCLCRAKR